MWGSTAPLLSGRDEAQVLSRLPGAGDAQLAGSWMSLARVSFGFYASPLSQGWLTIQGSSVV